MKYGTRKQRGNVLVITLSMMLLLGLLGAYAVRTAQTDTELSFNRLHSDQAFYTAEAGANRAFVQLNDSSSWRSGYVSVPFGLGDYSVTLIDSIGDPALTDTVIIRANGHASQANANVELWTVPEYIYPFRYAMFAEDGINMDRNTCTDSYDSDSGTYAVTRLDEDGDLGSNGTITTSEDVNIGGDVATATPGGISLGATNTVTGDTTSTADSVNLDIIPDSEYDWAAANSNAPVGLSGSGYNYNNGSKRLTLGAGGNVLLQSGVYFFSEITAGQSSQIQIAAGASVIIYITGDIVLNQSTTMNAGGSPSDLLIFSKGSKLQFDQDNVFNGAFYGPDATIQYDQTTQVFGALVGSQIQLDRYACFHYDRALGRVTHGTTGRMLAIAWRELSG